MTPKQRIWVIVGAILLALMLTNPSLKDFKEYTPSRHSPTMSFQKKANFLIASKYQIDFFTNEGWGKSHVHRTYLGIAKNFILLHED